MKSTAALITLFALGIFAAVLKRWCYDLMKAYIDSGMKEKARELKSFVKILGKY